MQNFRINRGDRNSWVLIDKINGKLVEDIYAFVHYDGDKKFFNVPLYCKRLRNSSPFKQQKDTCANDLPQESTSQQLIPGMSEKERLVASKQRNKKKKKKTTSKKTEGASNLLGKEYFFKNVNFKENCSVQHQKFQFSD